MKKIIHSRHFFLVIVSLLALTMATIEYLVVLHATQYSCIPMLIAIASYIGLFIYAFVFKKKQTKFNLLILGLIFTWMVTLFLMGRCSSNVGRSLVLSYQDRISILEFRFPGLLEEVQYEYNKISGSTGKEIYRGFEGLDLNLIVSIFMVLLSMGILLWRVKKESNEVVEENPPVNELTKSPYFLMVLVSFVGIIVSSIECIFLTYSASNASIVMIIGSIVFVGLFLSILFSKKRFTPYNFLIVAFIILWVGYAVEYLFMCLEQTNNGKIFYRLEFIFPCVVNKSCFDFSTGVKLSSRFEFVYINWLFSFAMCFVTFLVLFLKEKRLFIKK